MHRPLWRPMGVLRAAHGDWSPPAFRDAVVSCFLAALQSQIALAVPCRGAGQGLVEFEHRLPANAPG
jgi:hypothetical protein